MRHALFALLLSAALAGCSFSSSSPSPPAHNTTIVQPPASTPYR